MLPFFDNLRTDLELLDQEINQELKLKTGSIYELVPLRLDSVDYYLRPFLLLAISRAYGCRDKRAISVASVIQFIYLASRVHDIVHDNDQTEEFQFPVLVGDYLYGQFFLHLCQAEALSYLAPLATTICQMHEGGILRQQFLAGKLDADISEIDIVEKEEAMLFAVACKIGASLGGASVQEQELFWRFGKYLGLGVTALSQGLGKQVVGKALRAAKDVLTLFPVPVPGLKEISNFLEAQMT
ncbi:MAG: polyprenyl synthetase family protein [Peptococcaceae bacterium]|nr:polyprenyl synthetase family protein [Peptococcaceae bacterium]